MDNKIQIRPNIFLSEFVASDKPRLVQYLNDEVIFQNTSSIPHPYTQADADSWILHTQNRTQEFGKPPLWAIRHAEHGLIGSIGAFMRTGADGHLDEIGYWLAQPFQGQGIMTDAVGVLCEWMFEQRPVLVRIEAKVYAYNPASVRVLEKAGFVQEGLMRKAALKQGVHIDVVLLAKIRVDA